VDVIEPKNYSIKQVVDDVFAGIDASPAETELDEISKKIFTAVSDVPSDARADISWNLIAEVFRMLSAGKTVVTPAECAANSSDMDAASAKRILDVLFVSGVVTRDRRGDDFIFTPRDMGEKQEKAVMGIIEDIDTPVSRTDLKDVKKQVFNVLSGRRLWKDILKNVSLLLMINEVNMVLTAEGLVDGAQYSKEDIASFLEEINNKYLDGQGDDRALVTFLAEKHKLDNKTEALLVSRMSVLRAGGKPVEKWQFNARDIIKYFEIISKEMSSRTAALDASEKDLYAQISAYLDAADMQALEVDLYFLERMGMLDAGSDVCTYMLASFISSAGFDKALAGLKPNLLKMPVSALHFGKMRNFLFRGTWPMASLLFRSIQAYGVGGEKVISVKGRDLLVNLGYEVSSEAVNLLYDAVKQLNRIGLIGDYGTINSGKAFLDKVFTAKAMFENEKVAVEYVLDSLSPLVPGETDLEEIKRDLALMSLDPTLKGAYYYHRAISGDKTISDMLEKVDIALRAAYVKFLEEVGLIFKKKDRTYEAFGRFGEQPRLIREKMNDMVTPLEDVDLTAMRTDILEITEPLWSERILKQFDGIKDVLAKRQEKKAIREVGAEVSSKIVIAVGIDWIPAGQKSGILSLLKTLGDVNENVMVVTGDDIELGNTVSGILEEESIPWENVITMVDFDMLQDDLFWDIYNEQDAKNDSFVVGINATDLADDTYIRILEMIGMAMHQSFESKIYYHPRIGLNRYDPATDGEGPNSGRVFYIYSPHAEKIDITEARRIYNAQRKVLTNA